MVLIHRRVVIIGIGRHPVLHFEELIGVAVHISFGRSGKPHHDSIKILENSPVLFENAPMALVDDNEVKVGRGKQPLPVFGFGVVDGVENGGIGGKYNAGIPVVLIGAQIAQGHIRQIVLEIVLCLLDQRRAVCQKQDIRHPFSPAEHVSQTGCGAGLAGTGGHHQQVFAEPLGNMSAHRPDGLFLVIPVGDFVINGGIFQIQPLGAAVHQLL